MHGEKTGERILHDLCKWMDTYGSLATMRHGFKCYGRTLRVAFFKAAHGLNPELEARYAANCLGVTRQLHYSLKSEKSLDLVLCVNGIPVATLELKNPLTGQSIENGMRQYRRDRDPREKLFDFKKRSLVHFAVDTEAVHMTTRLAGSSTHFLPFNMGYNAGAGNPPDPEGRNYRTAYLWEDVLNRDSLLDLIARFLHVQIDERITDDGKRVKKEKVIIDEAHSSQSGETATDLKEVLGGEELREKARHQAAEEGEAHLEKLYRTMAKRGRQANLCFYAFTATPKHKTLKVFGRNGEPFHRYTMRQAIEEGASWMCSLITPPISVITDC